MTSVAKPKSQASTKSASRISDDKLVSLDSAIFQAVRVRLEARLGEVSLTVEEMLALKEGSVLKLGSRLNDTVDLYLDEQLVARGEIVAVDDHFGVRITDLAEA